MERDKEYLLPVEASDSDDIVEEFKLPPPRTRRPKARKAIAEARIAASNPNLLSWKCCLMFIVVSVFISGVLVLAFFMLSMQSEINKLSQKMAEANAQIRHHDSLEISTKKVMEKLESYKQKFSKQDLNIKLLVHQIVAMNKTIKKMSSSNELEHEVKTLERDVDSLKTGMAITGGSIDKIHSEIQQHDDRFDSVLTELKNVKIAMYNASTKNKTLLNKLTRPISAQTQQIRNLKVLIRNLNNSLEVNTQRIAKELYNKNYEMDEKIRKLDVAVDNVNFTHTEETIKIAKLVSGIKDKAAADLVKYSGGINFLMNFTGVLNKKIQHHHELLQNYTHLVKDVKRYKKLSHANLESIRAMDAKVAKHHELMSKQMNSSVTYITDILRLQNLSKTSEKMIEMHHQQLKEYIDKITAMKTQEKPTAIPVEVSPMKLNQTSTPGIEVSNVPVTVIPVELASTKSEQKSGLRISSVRATTSPSSSRPYMIVSHAVRSHPVDQDGCPIKCDKTERCNKTRKGYKCVCKLGYAKIGKYCEDVNECLTQNVKCHSDATCVNTYGSYTCMCNVGYLGNGTYCASSEGIETGIPSANASSVTSNATVSLTERPITKSPVNVAANETHVSLTNTSSSKQPVVTVNVNSSVATEPLVVSEKDDTSVANVTDSVAMVTTDALPTAAVKLENNTHTSHNINYTDASEESVFGTASPKPYSTAAGSYATPEMPDETGLYDGNDQEAIRDQEAKIEADKNYKIPQHSPRGKKIDGGVDLDSLNKMDRDDEEDKENEDKEEELNQLG